MLKRMVLVLMSVSMLVMPTCVNIDQDGLTGLVEDLACQSVASLLPWSGHVDYCSYVDFELTP